MLSKFKWVGLSYPRLKILAHGTFFTKATLSLNCSLCFDHPCWAFLFWFSGHSRHSPRVSLAHVMSIKIAYQAGLMRLHHSIYSPVRQYNPNNLIFHSPWQCFSLLKTEASGAICSGQVIFVLSIKCLPPMGSMSDFKLIAISHSSLDTDRSYREGAIEKVFANTSCPKRHTEERWGQRKELCWRLPPL